eukprot:CAMPEP_0182469088 /NCGR_PEP_ID=MMETSP1319-20130603/16525_1 /TAXON_ID=172717 /ORGANISM="Bolidomonas pacifica, Strain RCC208" /LENGTH=650 /DNA_ID=CAMNT_0024669355 /DNA_START=103 /DNA_END=2055 /DNA_ORIENTATION=+
MTQTYASWIDPDTPSYAQTTIALHPHQYIETRKHNAEAAARKKADDEATAEKTREREREKNERNNRTPAPSTSSPPTASPTTFSPTSSPTVDASPFKTFGLVMSDEFSVPGRSFSDGSDPRWTALDKNDYTNNALHYYAPSNAYTEGGSLHILTEAEDTDVVGFDDGVMRREKVTKRFKSAMLQSWNKFCFTGGIVEAEVVLPGRHDVGGLWPAFWLLGNIARHTYVGTSNNIWPWSMTSCDPLLADAQKLSGCLNTAHYGMKEGVGRGAPEIDIFEVQPGNVPANNQQFLKMPVGQPFSSASLQVAPGKSWKRPGPGNWPGPGEWYDTPKMKFGENTSMNINFYGTYNHFAAAPGPEYDYWSDAISQNRQLSSTHFERAHTFRLHWEPPSESSGDGFINWWLDDELIFSINGTSINSVTGAEIPSEPSYVLLNTAVSKDWGFPQKCPEGCPCKKYDCNSDKWDDTCGFSPGFCDMIKKKEPGADRAGAAYKVNWVRVYQDPDNPMHKVGCSTPERPTRLWIEGNEKYYKREGDSKPLKDVPTGGGACKGVGGGAACGGQERGLCVSGRCVCQGEYTGPTCLAAKGFDDIVWDAGERLQDLGFVVPGTGSPFFIGAAAATAAVAAMVWEARRRRRMAKGGYTPLPNALIP